MKSLKDLYKIGAGPSSSHTIGPTNASTQFKTEYETADSYKVILYGSLALTGVGHGTDKAILKVLGDNAVVTLNKTDSKPHPNTMELFAYKNSEQIGYAVVESVGGGAYKYNGKINAEIKDVYPHKNFAEIKAYCKENHLKLWQYVEKFEGKEIYEYIENCYTTMKESLLLGLNATGILPGGLNVERRAGKLIKQGMDQNTVINDSNILGVKLKDDNILTYESRIVAAYAFAVAESNASGENIVTAPTCGACGVIPSLFVYYENKFKIKRLRMIRGLMTAGIVGNIIKHNASISGAECGCQAEIGTACCMAAAGMAEASGMSLDEVEVSAEIALEHNLGLTCDPVAGLVQIPCIERNAMAAMKAVNAVVLATFLTESNKVSLDTVIETMYRTGLDMHHGYRETSLEGLAKYYEK